MFDLMTRSLSPLTDLSDDDNDSISRHPVQLTDAFVMTVLDRMNATVLTAELQEGANAQLLLFGDVPRERRILEDTEIDTLRVLQEMLDNAPSDRGKRYVASVVICCNNHNNRDDELFKLGSDFVNFLLWPFKSAYRSKTPTVSVYSSITVPETMTLVPEKRDSRFLRLLKERQAHKCAAAVIDPPGGDIMTVGAHIIRRSIAKANKSDAGLHFSLPATWDILRHYADLSEDTIQGLENIIDSPSNGILLETSMHTAFDDFRWYFEATDELNVYNVRWLTTEMTIWMLCGRLQVTFENYPDIPLPDARLLKIHAAIARVLRLSGAAESLDLVMERFDFGSSPVSSGKFGCADLDLRLSFLKLSQGHLSHLPTENLAQ